MGNKARNQGHKWERDVVDMLKSNFPHVETIGTSRLYSRYLDNKKIDIYISGKNSTVLAKFGIQCKKTMQNSLKAILEAIPTLKEFNVVFLKKTEKVKVNEKTTGTYAVLYLDDFLKLMKVYEEYSKLPKT